MSEQVPSALIYHIADADRWKKSSRQGYYISEKYIDEGFIHCSFEHQVMDVFRRYYNNQKNLIVLEIDCAFVKPKILVEQAENGDFFPHIYGPLDVSTVVRVLNKSDFQDPL